MLDMREEGATAGRELILLVEKDPISADSIGYYLETAGFRVEVIYDGARAVDLAASLRPDLVILEVILPGVNGLKVCRALKQQAETAAIRVLVYTVLQVSGRALEHGADGFLEKPIDRAKLIEAVKAILEGSGQKDMS